MRDGSPKFSVMNKIKSDWKLKRKKNYWNLWKVWQKTSTWNCYRGWNRKYNRTLIFMEEDVFFWIAASIFRNQGWFSIEFSYDRHLVGGLVYVCSNCSFQWILNLRLPWNHRKRKKTQKTKSQNKIAAAQGQAQCQGTIPISNESCSPMQPRQHII